MLSMEMKLTGVYVTRCLSYKDAQVEYIQCMINCRRNKICGRVC